MREITRERERQERKCQQTEQKVNESRNVVKGYTGDIDRLNNNSKEIEKQFNAARDKQDILSSEHCAEADKKRENNYKLADAKDKLNARRAEIQKATVNINLKANQMRIIQRNAPATNNRTRTREKAKKTQATIENDGIVYRDAFTIISSKFVFFCTSTFNSYRQFHNDKDRLTSTIEYLIDNELIYQSSDKNRFINGTRSSYAMATPNQIERNNLAREALTKLNLNINGYEKL
ncbi:unnamed protein product [Didymodactylos carnosus]|uniref:Uncharacterized protein n=1 Tax=Didymodactylos carnosus TaxID=1234261 RepID=A0A8S2FFV5_9BILA|nr:unnamed protein product [Didymodactylos carnosus]CAF4246955.1 unnamed protein product [Didymodactylos carnosus]